MRLTMTEQVLPQAPAEDETEAKAAIRVLVAAGRLVPPPGRSDVEPISEQERRELADRLGRAQARFDGDQAPATLEPPADQGKVTVADVQGARSAEGHAERVYR